MAATMLAMPLDGKDWGIGIREAREREMHQKGKKLATPNAFRSLAPLLVADLLGG